MAVEIANVGFEGFNALLEVVVGVDEHRSHSVVMVAPLAEVADRVATGERGEDEDGGESFHGIIRGVKDWLLCFFRTWNDVIVSLSAVVTAVSALVAVLTAVKHWRDDDTNLGFFVMKKSPNDGTYRYWYVIRIVNAGRHPIRFHEFIVRNGYPTAVNLGTYSYPVDDKRLLAPGEMITVNTIVVTEYDDVLFPESAEIWCKTSARELIYVTRVEFSDDCPALKAKILASVSEGDICFPGRHGWAKGYK